MSGRESPSTDEAPGERQADPDHQLNHMSVAECYALLRRHQVGRVALIHEDFPVIFPVNFVIDDGTVVFRTGAGTKLEAAISHARVAFECDGFDEDSKVGWSVVLRGIAELVTNSIELARLREIPLVPWVAGGKPNYIRVHGKQITGRRIGDSALPPPWHD